MEKLTHDEIDVAVEALKRGEIVAFPTETVYGLGAPIFDAPAVARIFQMKGRPADNPLIAHISDISMVEQIGSDVPADFYRLAAHFFPGPLALIVKKSPKVPSIAAGGLETIAIRMPRHPLALELIRRVGVPLVAPSANLSGRPSSTTASHVLDDFHGLQGYVLDGGPTELGIESTVVNLINNTILRPGVITQEEIESVLGRSLTAPEGSDCRASPGMRYRHYAPKAAVHLITDWKVFETYPSERVLKVDQIDATRLYAVLRQADTEGVDEVVIFCDSSVVQNRSLMDRLSRAASLTVGEF